MGPDDRNQRSCAEKNTLSGSSGQVHRTKTAARATRERRVCKAGMNGCKARASFGGTVELARMKPSGGLLRLFPNARCFAAQGAQVVQLRAAHAAMTHHRDRLD